jgi:hypothetical protein
MVLSAETVQSQIQRIINEDPTINEANHIVVSVEKKGVWPFGREVIVLKGNVRSDSDRSKAGKIATLHAAGREVMDEIRVLH